MNESTLEELFGGVSRFRALRSLFAEPGRGFGQRELAAEAGIDPGNVARLLKRWTAAGLVQRRQQDGLPRYYASADPSLAALATLMQQDSQLLRVQEPAARRRELCAGRRARAAHAAHRGLRCPDPSSNWRLSPTHR